MQKLKEKYQHHIKELDLNDDEAEQLIAALTLLTETLLTKKYMLEMN